MPDLLTIGFTLPFAAHALPPLSAQAERLVDLGVHEIAGLTADDLRAAANKLASKPATTAANPADGSGGNPDDGLLVIHPDLAPASALAPLLTHKNKPGFLVVDMPDVDQFTPLEGLELPAGPMYRVDGLDRGDHMENWSPDEALPAITADQRTPLTLGEGIFWLLQQPDALERGHCFMTIGSRLRKENGALDARTPAIWISNGTGRDGAANRNAPKVGWCWAGNRHTWLGFASAAGRAGA